MIGLVAREYGYSFEVIGELTAFQFMFLVEWLNWWGRKIGK